MYPPAGTEEAIEVLGKPLSITVIGRRVWPGRVQIGDRQVLQSAPCAPTSSFNHSTNRSTQYAVASRLGMGGHAPHRRQTLAADDTSPIRLRCGTAIGNGRRGARVRSVTGAGLATPFARACSHSVIAASSHAMRCSDNLNDGGNFFAAMSRFMWTRLKRMPRSRSSTYVNAFIFWFSCERPE